MTLWQGIVWIWKSFLIVVGIITLAIIMLLHCGCAVIEKPQSAIPSIKTAQDATLNATAQLDQIGPKIALEANSVRQACPVDALPEVDPHLSAIEACAAAVGDVSASLKTGVTPALAVATENVKATEKALAAETKRADAAEEKASSMILWILGIVAALSLLGGVGIIIYGVMNKSTTTITWGVVAMGMGGAATALYAFYDWIKWAGLGLMLLIVGYLVYSLIRQAKAASAATTALTTVTGVIEKSDATIAQPIKDGVAAAIAKMNPVSATISASKATASP